MRYLAWPLALVVMSAGCTVEVRNGNEIWGCKDGACANFGSCGTPELCDWVRNYNFVPPCLAGPGKC